MKLGTELLLKEDSFGYKKGEKVLYLRNCHDSGYYCVEAVVLDIDQENKRISLGMKQVEPNPWTLLEEKYPELEEV